MSEPNLGFLGNLTGGLGGSGRCGLVVPPVLVSSRNALGMRLGPGEQLPFSRLGTGISRSSSR